MTIDATVTGLSLYESIPAPPSLAGEAPATEKCMTLHLTSFDRKTTIRVEGQVHSALLERYRIGSKVTVEFSEEV